MTPHQELFAVSDKLASAAQLQDDSAVEKPLAALSEAAENVARSFSGSWLGYHARVYYANFRTPPPGAHFSLEWGLMDTFAGGSTGEWIEFTSDDVRNHILKLAGEPNLTRANEAAERARDVFSSAKSDIESILHTETGTAADTFLEGLANQIEQLKPLSFSQVEARLRPGGQVMTRDTTALGQNFQVPPHIAVVSEVIAANLAFSSCEELSQIARRAASHLERKAKKLVASTRLGTNVFIGHGRSQAWRDLKDFIQDRVRLPWDEFNRVPVAGVTNIARLSEMLDSAAIALLVMTAEDELADGKLQARMNVVHEAGLFQGRLGFSKAIILLEDGCEEFSNIAGLGQIRFPTGNVGAKFEEVRRVLEREGLIPE